MFIEIWDAPEIFGCCELKFWKWNWYILNGQIDPVIDIALFSELETETEDISSCMDYWLPLCKSTRKIFDEMWTELRI